jgi:hypothetical protein
VGNVGPCLTICNGEGKEGIFPLDVTPAPCLDVTPSCYIKAWKPRGVEERPRGRKAVRADAAMPLRVAGCVRVNAPMTGELWFFKKLSFLYEKKTHYIMVQIVRKSN